MCHLTIFEYQLVIIGSSVIELDDIKNIAVINKLKQREPITYLRNKYIDSFIKNIDYLV